jgi:ferredoxin
MTTVRIDRERCTGQGRCYTLAADVFDADDEGFGIVRTAGIEDGSPLAPQAETAVLSCPESAITMDRP